MFYTVPADQLLSVPSHFPPAQDTTLPLIISITTVLLTLALSTHVARLWTRWRQQLGLDDIAMTLAMLVTLGCYSLSTATSVITGGRHTVYVGIDVLIVNAKISFAFVFVWLWSVTLVKIAVCFMLLRVKSHSKAWLFGLWILVGLLLIIAIIVTITHMLMCRPITANWELTMIIAPGYCWSVERFVNFTYSYSAFFVLTDVICALLPAAFIWKINRPLRERIVLFLLMALGLLATFCGIMKMIDLKPSISSKDPLYDTAPTQIWALAEAFLGIFAANIPTLRRPLERLLRTITGKTLSHQTSSDRRIYDSKRTNDEDIELSRDLQLASQKDDVQHLDSVYTKPYAASGESIEQLTALPKACFVRKEFEIRCETRR